MAQIDPTVGDLDGNAARIRAAYVRAAADGADLVAFPELAVTGYPPEDLLHEEAFLDAAEAAFATLVRDLRGPAAIIGTVLREEGRLFNAAAVVAEGAVVAWYRKMQLPNYGVFDEMRYFAPGVAPLVVDVGGIAVGVTVCEDAWQGGAPVAASAAAGAEIIVNINASPYHAGRGTERVTLIEGLARDNAAWVLYVQTVGGQDEIVFDGDSLAVDPTGRTVARGKQFVEDLVFVDIDLPGMHRPGDRPVVTSHASARVPLDARIEAPAATRAKEVYRALVLGTGDYVRKNGFTGAVIGLSGGIDSALTAAIAVDALGADAVTGIAMPSRYSSTHSVEDAKALAGNLGIAFHVVPIEQVHAAFLATLGTTFPETTEGLAAENLQARIRGTILMAFSNASGAIVLTTGNKSELAMGYATLYGDMAGGFAVLKDVPKTLVYECARWRSLDGGPIPESSITKPPSAELRPDQKDSDSLPPYDELDPIIAWYVEHERAPEGADAAVVARVIATVDRSEYKRRQAPPGVKITPRSFGKDRRMPITNRFRRP